MQTDGQTDGFLALYSRRLAYSVTVRVFAFCLLIMVYLLYCSVHCMAGKIDLKFNLML